MMERGKRRMRGWLGSVAQDVRFALRMLMRRPRFSLLVIIVLAVGIGLNAAMFSVLDAVLLRPLPYRDARQLTIVWQSSPKHRATGEWFNSYRDFEEWTRRSRSFRGLAAFSWATGGQTVEWRGRRRDVLAIPVSADFFSVLGVAARYGRTFQAGDAEGGCAVVLSYRYWRDVLGGDPGMTGKTLTLGQQACAVLGVMPKSFSFYPRQTELWTLITPESNFARQPWKTPAGVMGRLRPGVSRAAAEEELSAIQASMAAERPPDLVQPPSVPVVLDMQREFTWLTGRNLREGLWLLFAAVAMVLLIACVNVANLLLGRAAERQREMAIRASIGCGRRRMVRQLLTESLVLCGCGAVAGVGLAALVVQMATAWNPIVLPPGNEVEMRWPVVLFAAGLAMLCTLLSGMAPAWRASRTDLSAAFRTGGTHPVSVLRIGRVLVVLEVGLSLTLLSTALLLTKSLMRLTSTPLGYRTDHLLTAEVKLAPGPDVTADLQERTAKAMLSRLEALPGVRGVALASNVEPIGSDVLAVEGRRFDERLASHDVATQVVSDTYLRTAELPLLAGRDFSPADAKDGRPVALVSAALVKEYFPAGNAIGRRMKLGRPEDASAPWLTIVGVVGDVKGSSVFQEMGFVTRPVAYRPMAQEPGGAKTLLVRTGGNPMNEAKDVERVAEKVNRDLMLADVQPVEHFLSSQNVQPRFRTVLLGGFAGMALLLAAMGVYGVLLQRVVERTVEIGIRMALGSSRRRIVSRVLGEAVRWVAAGMAVGGMGAFAANRAVAGLLYETRAGDPWMIVIVLVLLIATVVAAGLLPAWRASRVDPMVVMRAE